MKKICAVFILISMIVSLTACGNSMESNIKTSDNSYSSTSSDTDYTVSTSDNSTTNYSNSTENSYTPTVSTSDTSTDVEQIIANGKLQYPSSNDEYEYNVYDTYIEITKYIGNDTDVTIPSTIDNLPVLVIGEKAFYQLKNLTSITIPDSVISIDNRAFSYCKSLTNIDIGNSVKTIGDSTFSSCSSLISVKISDSVTTIGAMAFEDCTNLTNVTIGNNVTLINYRAFEHCSNLTNISIPNNVIFIDSGAFYRCENLTNAYIYSTNCSFNENHSTYSSIGEVYSFESTVTLYGYAGSTTAVYCTKYGNNFKLIEE